MLKHAFSSYNPLLAAAQGMPIPRTAKLDRYLDNGKMYVLDDNGVKCECVITDEGNDILEIKNIATVPEYQGKGYAKPAFS